jgi:hydroxylamine reductase (hybrid-cluster protein)
MLWFVLDVWFGLTEVALLGFVCVCAGKLEHIFVIGGCDGSEPQRKYYDKLARLMPLNTMVRSSCR